MFIYKSIEQKIISYTNYHFSFIENDVGMLCYQLQGSSFDTFFCINFLVESLLGHFSGL